MEIRLAAGETDLRTVRELFLEYARTIEAHLCFQKFQDELDALSSGYYQAVLLATVGGKPAGCVALRPFGGGAAEMKRLYVRTEYRSLGVGRRLAEEAMTRARSLGYTSIRLDTIPEKMPAALMLYRRLGFEDLGAVKPDGILDMQAFL